MNNAALFSTVAREYANFRPGYPAERFEWRARQCPSRDAAWDCGRGPACRALADPRAQACRIQPRDLPFPFAAIDRPPFGQELDWNAEQVIGYASSWSATANYRRELARAPLPALRQALLGAWPAPRSACTCR